MCLWCPRPCRGVPTQKMPLSDCSQSGMDMRQVFCNATGTNAVANVSMTVFQNPPASWPRWCLRCGTVCSKLRWQHKSHKLDDMSFAEVLQNVQDLCLVLHCIKLVLSHGILFPNIHIRLFHIDKLDGCWRKRKKTIPCLTSPRSIQITSQSPRRTAKSQRKQPNQRRRSKKQTNNPRHKSQAFKHDTPNVFLRNGLQGILAQVPPCPCVTERLPRSETVANRNTPKRLTANKIFFM